MALRTTLIMMQACGALVFSTALLAETTSNTEQSVYLNEGDAQIKDGSDIELQTLQVQGRALSLYKEDEATLATKTATPIDKTPQSVQVVTEALIEDQAARQITDLYRSISGMSQNNVANVTLRGFNQDEILYDGMRGDPFSGFSIPQLFTIEQVQVLKGPSGALYGAGEPGGVINYVTKKPTYEQKNTLKISAGNKDFLSGSIESSGPANEDASQRYRVGVYSDGQDSYRTNVEEENQIIDLGYAWDIDSNNTLNLQYTKIHQYISGARLRGIPTDDDGNFLADTSWNSNSSSDFQELDAEVFQARLDHDINAWLTSNLTLRYFENTETQKYHEVTGISSTDSDMVTRQYRDQVRNKKGTTVAGNLIAELGDHTVLVGADYFHLYGDFLYYRSNSSSGVSDLSLSNPQYTDNVSDYTMPLYKDEETVLDRVGVFAQDQWAITNKLDLTTGVRFDRYEEKYTNNIKNTETEYDDTGYSARIGATYALNEHIKPYVSASTGFVPQSASDQASSTDGYFDPEESHQIEAGLRTYWLKNKLNVNIAAYRIIRENILQEDPNDASLLVSIGKVRSQGIEIDVMADITPRWVANVNYAYNDTVVKESTDADIQYSNNDRFANTPYNQLGLWTRYDFPSITSSIAFGADYVSDQINRQGQTIKPYAVYDASWQTSWEDWKFQLNIKNLFDKEYAVSGFTEKNGSFVGERRRVYVTAAYDF